MTDFNKLRKVCKDNTVISAQVIDKFLMHYAADREGLDKEMQVRLMRFRSVIQELGGQWLSMVQAQYISHRIFRKDGYIKKYLQHSAIKKLPVNEFSFLEQQAITPWRYSFGFITGNPDTDFYEMEDAFTGGPYLLYSPSFSKILLEGPVVLWFNLLAFNGSCWQTYGPIISYPAFSPDDIFFFATELNPAIDSEEMLMEDVEYNPFPYSMLVDGSKYPLTVSGTDEILQVFAEHSLPSFDGSKLKNEFKVEYAQGVYRVSIADWSGPPHFAYAFYVEKEKRFLLSSMTDRGFEGMVAKLNEHGLGLETAPDIRVHLTMLICIKNILGKNIQLNPYEDVFEIKPAPGQQEDMDKLNRLLALAIPIINAGHDPDIAALAKEAGVDEEIARELLKNSIDRINELKRKS